MNWDSRAGSPGEAELVIVLGKRRWGKSTWAGKFLASKPRRFIFDPFAKFPAEYLTEQQVIERHENGLLHPTKSPRLNVASCFIGDIDLLASVAFLNGHAYFVIEECGVAFNVGERLSEPLQEALFLGGHNWLSIVLVAQRAASIPIPLRSQATRVVTFRQDEENDVKWLRPYFREQYEDIPQLEKLECLDSENGDVRRYSIVP